MKIRREKDFMSCFDSKTGAYFRTGILKNRKESKEDPFMASFPELLDVGIMGHCKHGVSGLCIKAGVECYQDGLHSDQKNMSLEDFKYILKQCEKDTYQIALGGCGDPDQHEFFEEILESCREADIVPNFTTSGLGMTRELAAICKKYCGSVAVSWYRSQYSLDAIEMLLQAGVKTNIHYVLMKDSIEEAKERLMNKGFPEGINAIVFLLHKPVGLGTKEQIIEADNKEFAALLDCIDEEDFLFKIGFDSCTIPALVKRKGTNLAYVDTCEGGRWSAYISADMKMMPCSFDNQKQLWAVDLTKYTIQEAWNSKEFADFREHFLVACPECIYRKDCMGGCPICPEIVLCSKSM